MMKTIFIALFALLGVSCASQPKELKVMTFNMRYDNPEDGINCWDNRKSGAAEVIRLQQVDVFGTQELLAHQLDDLKDLLPEYEAVGVGREDGVREGEFAALFFRRDAFQLIDSGNFWLSETPEKAGSLGWDAACERIVTWAVLKNERLGEILFVNTHLDHVGEQARLNSADLIMKRMQALGGGDRPIVLTGDFNVSPDAPVVHRILEGGFLKHALDVADEVKGQKWSWADYGEQPLDQRELIDYIFVSNEFKVRCHEVLPDTLRGAYISDHSPVTAALEL